MISILRAHHHVHIALESVHLTHVHHQRDRRPRTPARTHRARAHGEAVFLERRGKLEAVMVSPAQYERMVEALEDAEDVAAFDAAMADEGPNIPWAQVKSDLGWE